MVPPPPKERPTADLRVRIQKNLIARRASESPEAGFIM
jgi:hypothetical protein